MMQFSNPLLSGFYPDPSICRVGTDYYLVTSSFEYFPGVPIFHSRDLIHWQQIGHCLTRPSQLPLEKAISSKGIFAPTLRYHDGKFYMVTTNVSMRKHFYVFTEDPAGEWSEPVWVEQGGIDSSLFFDEDGKVYFSWSDLARILQAEIDILTGQLLTEPRVIWTGSGGRYPEGPHLYKINGLYYLMIAEGGTEYGHMETIARSQSPWGPFESCLRNPILTHRDDGTQQIQGTGHADLIEAHDGSWWLVFLAFRMVEQFVYYHHLGRETYLAPVEWDADGWPVVNQNLPIKEVTDIPTLPPHPWEAEATHDDFDTTALKIYWNYLRNPHLENYSLTERPGWLRLKGTAITLDEADSPTFLGRRQQHFRCKAITRLDFSPRREGEEAGLTALMNEQHHYEIAVGWRAGERTVFVRRRIGTLSAIVAEERIPDGLVDLQIQADNLSYTFGYAMEGQSERVLTEAETRYLSSEVAGGFTGVYFGLYSTGTGKANTSPADFDWFEYQPLSN